MFKKRNKKTRDKNELDSKTLMYRPFERRMLETGTMPNILAGALISIYIIYFSGILHTNIGMVNMFLFVALIMTMTIISQFIIAPKTNHLITGSITKRINELFDSRENHEDTFSIDQMFGKNNTEDIKDEDNQSELKQRKERTKLMRDLMQCPLWVSLQVTIVFSFTMIICWLFLTFYCKLKFETIMFIVASYTMGCYVAGVLSYIYAEKLCSQYAMMVSALGLYDPVIRQKHCFGLKTGPRILLYIILPYVISNFLQVVFMYNANNEVLSKNLLFVNTCALIMLNTSLVCLLSTFLYKQETDSTKLINIQLEKLLKGELENSVSLSYDLSNELSYSLYQVNEIITYLQSIINEANLASIGIKYQTTELSSFATKTAQTSEILSRTISMSTQTMDINVKKQLNEISKHIADVSFSALVTKENVDSGLDLLRQDIAKISDISTANLDTIAGIKNVSEMIDNVWVSIKKIDALAQKSRIIAFNAELEATAAGERGENFHIVANEIRRLADTISDSTKEIKARIKDFQHSSDNLIITSEGGTQKIREGSEFFSNMETKFNELKVKSDITAEYANDIKTLIASQDESFVQINTTLSQIDRAAREFVQSTNTLSLSAENIKLIAGNLTSVYSNIMEEE